MATEEARPTISIVKAADIVGVSRRTIYNWLKIPGRLEWKRTAGGAVRIYVDSLWRDQHKAPIVAVVVP